MPDDLAQSEPLPPEREIALSYTPLELREKLRAFFSLDQRLAHIISQASEPMLAQLRLAWWRDTLGKPSAERPSGDRVLDAIGRHWEGREDALVALIDGWECMLAETPLGRDGAKQFAEGRASGFSALMDLPTDAANKVHRAAQCWALADAAAHIGSDAERDLLVYLGLEQAKAHLPKPLRGLAVLAALSKRALAKGGRPLMEGRPAALIAFRVGLLGR